MTVLENVMLAARNQPGEHLWRIVLQPKQYRQRNARSPTGPARP